MKIVVGTLYCGENEYEACCAAISSQTLKPVEHFVIENLPNHEAHDAIYKRFMSFEKEADLFIKIDADMVLDRPTLFEEIAAEFEQDNELDHLQIALHDFFTNQLIAGINTFRSTCRWGTTPNSLFVDHKPVNVRKRRNNWTNLAPAADHCPNPSKFQAFHFGLHKALKVIEAAQKNEPQRFWEHVNNIEKTWKHYVEKSDIKLLFACAGAEAVFSSELKANHVDWDSSVSKEIFCLLENSANLPQLTLNNRRKNRQWLPANLWYSKLIGGYRGFIHALLALGRISRQRQ